MINNIFMRLNNNLAFWESNPSFLVLIEFHKVVYNISDDNTKIGLILVSSDVILYANIYKFYTLLRQPNIIWYAISYATSPTL
jgi:hypothetical protein